MSDLHTRLIQKSLLKWENNIPHDQNFGDLYYSRQDGLAESKTVFLDACGLPQSLKKYRCIAELGFGSGLNALALMQARNSCPQYKNVKLDLVSFDAQLMSAPDARRAHQAWPELEPYSKTLLAHWPPPVRGIHRMEPEQGFRITLFLEQINRALPQTIATIHAWFLDGFSPAKNPQMWQPEIFAHMARLSAPGARFGTWSAAGSIRRGLQQAGFSVIRAKGFSGKRQRLHGSLTTATVSTPAQPKSVLILGAGIAGASCARAFLREGCKVTVMDPSPPASQTSGNELALLAPRLDTTDTPTSRMLLHAFLIARQWYDQTSSASKASSASKDCTRKLAILHLAKTTRMQQKFARLAANPPLPASLLRFKTQHQALLSSYIIRPKYLILQWLQGAKLLQDRACKLNMDGVYPQILTAQGYTYKADLLILACGAKIQKLIPSNDFRFSQGQLETAFLNSRKTRAVMDGQYVLQWDNQIAFGSGFQPLQPGEEAAITTTAKENNLQALNRLRPDLNQRGQGEKQKKGEALTMLSRASVRISTPDRLPIAGWMPGYENVMIAAALGARGFCLAPFIAACLADMACKRPPPIEKSGLDTLSPERYLHTRLG